MTNEMIYKVFKNKDRVECPLSDKLVLAGYRQKSGGYIKYAKQLGIENPSQYWHLIYSWCKRRPKYFKFNKTIKCGELLFWMAEVSGCVEYSILEQLLNIVLDNYLNDRKGGNNYIQKVCFDKIKAYVILEIGSVY